MKPNQIEGNRKQRTDEQLNVMAGQREQKASKMLAWAKNQYQQHSMGMHKDSGPRNLSMKKEIGVALLCLMGASAPVMAQTAVPPCGASNFDQSRYVFTVMNPVANAVNQQCLLTVFKKGAAPALAREFPALYPMEGNYVVEISGGGGGGGGGANNDKGGGGGGAGAAPSRSIKFLSAGVYKLTLGTGGSGGAANGGRTEAGNPSSMTKGDTLVAGFQGADVWNQRSKAAGDGSGGVGAPGGSTGGSGGDKSSASTGKKGEQAAQIGSASATSGYTGVAGQSGDESGRSAPTKTGYSVQANAGGGGGAAVGSGGDGASSDGKGVAEAGRLGAGGGGGHGGLGNATGGGEGGHGFIRLIMTGLAP